MYGDSPPLFSATLCLHNGPRKLAVAHDGSSGSIFSIEGLSDSELPAATILSWYDYLKVLQLGLLLLVILGHVSHVISIGSNNKENFCGNKSVDVTMQSVSYICLSLHS